MKSWKTDQYFVSPWNYLEEVRKDFNLPGKIKIHDVTLRDGEQETGVALRKDEKVYLAEKLAEAGIHRIEAGMPVVSKQDEAAIREIVKRNLGPEIFSFCRCVLDDVKLAADCGVSGVVVEIPSSEHIIEYAYQWPLAKAIDLSVRATRYAHEQGLYVVFFTIDATRADLNWIIQLIEKVAEEGHMDALAMVDTMGVAHTAAIRHYTRLLKQRIHKPLEAHFHNNFGLANANTLAAVEEGAEVVHSTLLGMGEGSGQASTEQLALALELLYGFDTGIKLNKLTDLGRLAAKLTGHTIPTNQPLIGEHLFHIASGIPSAWWLKIRNTHPTELFPVLPSLIGQAEPELMIGKGCGADIVMYFLDQLGMQATNEQILAMLPRIKEQAMAKKGLLTLDEFQEIAASVLEG